MLWSLLEALPMMSFVALLVTVPTTAVLLKERKSLVRENERTVAGRRVRVGALATPWPHFEVRVESPLDSRTLRARAKGAARAKERKRLRIVDVSAGVSEVRVAIRGRLDDTPDGAEVRDVVLFVIALESASAVDGEGGPGGVPVAVRATGA